MLRIVSSLILVASIVIVGTQVAVAQIGGAGGAGGTTGEAGTAQGGQAADAGPNAIVALFHFDGTEGSTELVDSSGSGKLAAVYGNPQISTTERRLGTGSLRVRGDGTAHEDFVLFETDGLDFTFAGDFTIDWWQNAETVTNAWGLFVYVGNSSPIALDYSGACSDGTSAGIGWDSASVWCYTADCGAVSTGAWQHMAIARSGTVTRYFVDGVLVHSITQASVVGGRYLSVSGAPCEAPGAGDNGDFNGYIDELRVVKGVALWMSDFTPPAAPYDPGDGSLGVAWFSPTSAMNLGPTTFRVIGRGFEPDASARLVRDGSLLVSGSTVVLPE